MFSKKQEERSITTYEMNVIKVRLSMVSGDTHIAIIHPICEVNATFYYGVPYISSMNSSDLLLNYITNGMVKDGVNYKHVSSYEIIDTNQFLYKFLKIVSRKGYTTYYSLKELPEERIKK